jgi:hypothetical protein
MPLARGLLAVECDRPESEMQRNISRERRAVLETVIGDLQRVTVQCALAGAREEAEQLNRIVLRLLPFVDLPAEHFKINPFRT